MPINMVMYQYKTFKDFVRASIRGDPMEDEAIRMAAEGNESVGQFLATLVAGAAAFCAVFETDDIDVAYQKFLLAYGGHQ